MSLKNPLFTEIFSFYVNKIYLASAGIYWENNQWDEIGNWNGHGCQIKWIAEENRSGLYLITKKSVNLNF